MSKNISEIIHMYCEDKLSIVSIAKRTSSGVKTIRNILTDNNIPIRREIKNPVVLYKNMKGHLKFDVSLEWLMQFDLDRLKILNKMARYDRLDMDREKYIKYITKFYNDPRFDKVYLFWLSSGRDFYAQPSLDHIHSKSNKGSNELDNLQVLTWFENRAKRDMNMDQWKYFKLKFNLKCDYFV